MAAVTDSLWWTHEVVEPSGLVMLKASNITVQLSGDAPTAAGSAGSSRKRSSESLSTPAAPKRKAKIREHNMGSDG
eukprot:4199778-Amphidinium_carterae.1